MSGDLFTGTLELLILRTLSDGFIHGYGIARRIRKLTDGVLDVEQGALIYDQLLKLGYYRRMSEFFIDAAKEKLKKMGES